MSAVCGGEVVVEAKRRAHACRRGLLADVGVDEPGHAPGREADHERARRRRTGYAPSARTLSNIRFNRFMPSSAERKAELQYAGSAPALVNGMFQVNVQVPDPVPPGPAIGMAIQVGSNISPDIVTLAIR